MFKRILNLIIIIVAISNIYFPAMQNYKENNKVEDTTNKLIILGCRIRIVFEFFNYFNPNAFMSRNRNRYGIYEDKISYHDKFLTLK